MEELLNLVDTLSIEGVEVRLPKPHSCSFDMYVKTIVGTECLVKAGILYNNPVCVTECVWEDEKQVCIMFPDLNSLRKTHHSNPSLIGIVERSLQDNLILYIKGFFQHKSLM